MSAFELIIAGPKIKLHSTEIFEKIIVIYYWTVMTTIDFTITTCIEANKIFYCLFIQYNYLYIIYISTTYSNEHDLFVIYLK